MLVALAATVVVVAVGLQSGGGTVPGPTDEPGGTPPRRVEREPPERGAIVLEETEVEEGVLQTLVVLPAQADAYISSDRPGQNFGMEDLYLGYNLNGYGAERILLRFNLEAIPRGGYD
jgi:hypothetical protein